ncbi:hypothetical protein [Poritiphilus flavus]|uniref:Uncharacterized protein n=1 Tax=Poritiphilus flavus TaxID=2697053 RepID=A0A6L9EBU6_9FLAO|nr:hypothetical protein [Poritiphilus flavus]NAS12216.1 hypothetical protein [Poritiphilus flavus]
MKVCSNNIGQRVRRLRTEVYVKTQEEFVTMINGYLSQRKLLDGEGKFTQNTMARLETLNSITSAKLTHLMNFLYDTKGINPAWVMLDRNETLPPYLEKSGGEIDPLALQSNIREHQQQIDECLELFMRFMGLKL